MKLGGKLRGFRAQNEGGSRGTERALMARMAIGTTDVGGNVEGGTS